MHVFQARAKGCNGENCPRAYQYIRIPNYTLHKLLPKRCFGIDQQEVVIRWQRDIHTRGRLGRCTVRDRFTLSAISDIKEFLSSGSGRPGARVWSKLQAGGIGY
jgi:hypothetical protein